MKQNKTPSPPQNKRSYSNSFDSPPVCKGIGSGEGDCLTKIAIIAIFSGFYLASQIYSDIEIWYNKKNFNLVEVNKQPEEMESNTIYYWENLNQIHCFFLGKDEKPVNISLDILAKPQNLNSTELNDWKKNLCYLKYQTLITVILIMMVVLNF